MSGSASASSAPLPAGLKKQIEKRCKEDEKMYKKLVEKLVRDKAIDKLADEEKAQNLSQKTIVWDGGKAKIENLRYVHCAPVIAIMEGLGCEIKYDAKKNVKNNIKIIQTNLIKLHIAGAKLPLKRD